MDIRQARAYSEEHGASPENDRRWASEKIYQRATGGYCTWEIREIESMPSGGTTERLEALLLALESNGYKVEKRQDFGGSFMRVSW